MREAMSQAIPTTSIRVRGALLFVLGFLLSAQISRAAGPILIVGSDANPFSIYHSEILRAEGVNAFDTADISAVTASSLSSYDVVILGDISLTTSQVTMFTNWVNSGGNLIAMRPDKQLAGLLGLADAGATLSNSYLSVNTAGAPGAGIVGQTIQFHGTADLYTAGSVATIATLFSSATAPTPHPAVTLRVGIGAGGRAAAFTYDLARSVVYTRQGNPAWAGQSRINQGGPIRSSDMFYGAAVSDLQPDWIDLNKVSVPQADEQQRLLVNLILHMNQTKKPLPRFWYFPFGKKAAVIMTGDDHANGATAPRFDDYIAASPPDCSVANWECVRGTSYVYYNSPITDTQAADYEALGFEVALHVNTDCASYTPASLEDFYVTGLSLFATNYPSVPAPTTNRTHCIAWSDWATQAEVSLTHGIRLDTNYYYWPPSWVVQTPGFFTGSGIPMRFARTDGSMIDVYQAATQMTDESGQAYPDTINGLLDNAIGAAGFYGAFTANIHTDSNTGNSKVWSDQIVASALSRGVPVITARQMLTWLDGRNGSSFGDSTWSGNTLTFSLTTASGANGLQAMLPTNGPTGVLTALARGGQPVTYTLQVIKGVQYAFFPATAGSYAATYAGAAPPVISTVSANPGTTTATITWATDRPANSRVDYGTTASLGQTATSATLVTDHSISLTGLATGTTYYYRVTSVDGSGGSATAPLTGEPPVSFTTIDPNPPVITSVAAVSGFGGSASVTWLTNKIATSRVDYGTSPSSLSLNASNTQLVTTHSVTLSGLTLGATYYYRVTSVDSLGNATTWPVASDPPANFIVTTAATIWPLTATPAVVEDSDSSSVELGLKFRSDLAGVISGVRFHKGPNNTGTHVGKLWTSQGALLGSVTFTNETASGWQQANFAPPIPISANTTYVVSYLAPNGRYSLNESGLTAAVINPPLRALADGADGPNGVYQYGTGGFPNQSYNASNYWVDVVFNDTAAPAISGVVATPSPTSAVITWATNEPATSRVDYGTSPSSLTQSVTGTENVTSHSLTLADLTAGTTYYYRVTSVDASGNSTTSPAAPAAPASFVPADTTPPVISAVVAGPGSTTATITWTTNEAATSRVDYGTTPSHLTSQVTAGALVTNHDLVLTGLQIGTTYYYRVTSADVAGNSATSPVAANPPASFTTIDPTPPIISSVAAAADLGGLTRIAWTTNKLANSRVDYGTTPSALNVNVSSTSLTTSHNLALSGLTLGTTYYYRVTSVDSLGNATTQPAPPNPPASFIASTAVTIWVPSTVPATPDSGDTSAVELGLKFRSDTGGIVSAVRFYKSAANTGTHVGKLWTSTGTLLGSVTFTNETASGWQQANFASPIQIAPDTTYIVSYHTPNGRYSLQSGAFATAGVNNPPLRALANGFDGGNGVYIYGGDGFPNQSWNATNYFVDVVFTDNTPPAITAPLLTPSGSSANVAWATSKPATSRVDYGVSPNALTQTVSSATLVTSHNLNLTGLVTGTTYYYRITAVDSLGNSATWPPLAEPPASFVAFATHTIWSASATPAVLASTDTSAVELGLKFRSDVAGIVTGVRFYKGSGNTGTHVGTLWTSTGTPLGSVTFTNESAGGWQQANFASPIAITANSTYVVSYHADNPPLRALASGVDGQNGVYLYGAGGFPNQSWNDSNYWVDVVFADNLAPTISKLNTATTATSATITWTTNEAATSRVDYGTSQDSLSLSATGATPATSHSVTLTGLTTGVTYYFRVTSTDASGNSSVSPAPPSQPASVVPATAPSPVITALNSTLGSTSALITWTTDLAANSRVDYGTSPTTLNLNAADSAMVTSHSIPLNGLTAFTTYYYRITSTTAAGGSSTSPAVGISPASFTTSTPSGGGGTATSIWSPSATPSVVADSDTAAVELGLKFRSDVAGQVRGIRFYKSTANTGTHVGNLWTSSGALLASVTFTNETASGWQEALFASPVNIAANTTYVVSYYAPVGRYSADSGYFSATGVDSPPLHALRDGVDGPNGLYRYGAGGGFPTSSYQSSNYWVDVVFADNVAPSISGVNAGTSATAATITWATNEPASSRVDYGTSPGALTQNVTSPSMVTSHSISLTGLTTGVTYHYRVTAVDPSGNIATSPAPPNSPGTVVPGSAAAPVISALTVTPGSTAALVTWSTDLASNSRVEYGTSPTSLTLTATDAALVTAHSVSLSGLAASNIYYYRVTSITAAGGLAMSPTAESPAASFTTTTPPTGGPEPLGWFAGDMHVHRSCGGSPEALSSLLERMAPNNLAVISLLADSGNGEVQNPTTDLPLVTGLDSPVSTPGRIVHWDAEWHWDATYTQFPHQALGGHLVTLGTTEAHQIWEEYTYPVLNWARQTGGIAGFAHMQYLPSSSIPQSLNCCIPIEYPVEVALGAADFISEDVDDSGSGIGMNPDGFIQAYYRLLNTGFRPGFAAGTDYPCNNDRPLGALLTYSQPANGQMTYRNWIQGIASGRTVVSRNGHNEFLALTVNGTATPGDQINLATAGNVSVNVQWTAAENLTGAIELVHNGVVVATSNPSSVAPGTPVSWNTTINFTKSGWLAARRMGADGHQVHTAAVFVLVNNAPIRASVADAQFYVQWMDELLVKTSPSGPWNSFFTNNLAEAQARYQAARTIFAQRAVEAGAQ
jgi:phosphodiesterase/alkaline phosphatase D-like protein